MAAVCRCSTDWVSANPGGSAAGTRGRNIVAPPRRRSQSPRWRSSCEKTRRLSRKERTRSSVFTTPRCRGQMPAAPAPLQTHSLPAPPRAFPLLRAARAHRQARHHAEYGRFLRRDHDGMHEPGAHLRVLGHGRVAAARAAREMRVTVAFGWWFSRLTCDARLLHSSPGAGGVRLHREDRRGGLVRERRQVQARRHRITPRDVTMLPDVTTCLRLATTLSRFVTTPSPHGRHARRAD